MKRLIFVTFVFLGWAFYVASGGADYAPRPGSLQARVAEKTPEPIRELSDLLPSTQESPETRTITSLADLDMSKAEDTQITYASSGAADQAIEEAGALIETGIDEAKVAALTSTEEEPAIASDEPAALPEGIRLRDIRRVSGDIVNMRSGAGTSFERIGKLTKGTEIEVLEDPGNSWVSIQVVDTGEIGWIAEWLITAAN